MRRPSEVRGCQCDNIQGVRTQSSIQTCGILARRGQYHVGHRYENQPGPLQASLPLYSWVATERVKLESFFSKRMDDRTMGRSVQEGRRGALPQMCLRITA